jgi:NAD(P)H-dependent FMN reductase
MLRFLVIVGSTRQGRRGKAVADWFLTHARRLSPAQWEEADLAALNLPWYESAMSPAFGPLDPDPRVQRWARMVADSDAFVWVTPEYNHGYPAALKNAIDHLYREWVRKPVAIISYGAGSGGVRAVEQLRQVAVELQMAPIRFSVHLPVIRQLINDQGVVEAPDAVPGIAQVVEDLAWWARALKAAREETLAEAATESAGSSS